MKNKIIFSSMKFSKKNIINNSVRIFIKFKKILEILESLDYIIVVKLHYWICL